MNENIQFHSVANIFPLLDGEEYQKLVDDIKINGLIDDIITLDGLILDGRNRYLACLDADIEPRFVEWPGSGSPLSFVISKNLHRRHLNSSQRAAIAVEALPLFEAEARERMISGGEARQQGVAKIPHPEEEKGKSRDKAADAFDTNPRYVQDAKKLAEEEPELFEKVKSGEMTIPKAKQEVARRHVPEPVETPEFPNKRYRCIVIDPPWPIKKIEREERPNQGVELDYPTMSLEDIAALPIGDMADTSGCHLYLWTTQKFLPAAIAMVGDWGFKYQCILTWVKNVGFTPYSWMYDTEHVVFATSGHAPLDRLGLRLSFSAKVIGHSIKPDIFYEGRVIPASPEPRLEMFARKNRDGFEVWGNEI